MVRKSGAPEEVFIAVHAKKRRSLVVTMRVTARLVRVMQGRLEGLRKGGRWACVHLGLEGSLNVTIVDL